MSPAGQDNRCLSAGIFLPSSRLMAAGGPRPPDRPMERESRVAAVGAQSGKRRELGDIAHKAAADHPISHP